MWKWSIITDEVSQNICAAAAFARAHGLSGLEIRSVFGRDALRLTDANVRSIGNCARNSGLSVCALASPLFKCNLDDEPAVRAHLDAAKRFCEIAHTLGARIVRGFGFWRAPNAAEIPYARIAEQITRAIPVFEDADVSLALENDPSVCTPDGRTLARLVEVVNHPRVGAVWDPGNVLFDPGGEAPYPDGYRAVRGRMLHMHLKDARRVGGVPEAVAFGAGEVDYRGQFAGLRADGYDGWVSIETHYRLERALDEAALRLPAGFDFSEGGASASADFIKSMAERLNEWGMGALYAGREETKWHD